MSDPNSQIGKWYRKPRWQRRAALQMKEHPLCAMCLGKSIVTAAKIADHIVPHKGNEAAFWFGALQSLCPSCHSGLKAVIEKRGYSDEIGADGYTQWIERIRSGRDDTKMGLGEAMGT